MYTAENYLWGLAGYYLGSLLVLLYLWRYRKVIPGRHFRGPFILLVACVLLVPVTAYINEPYLAPAWFVSLFEGLTEATEQGYMRAAQPIVVVYIGAVVFYIVGAVFSARRQKEKSRHSTTEMPAEELVK